MPKLHSNHDRWNGEEIRVRVQNGPDSWDEIFSREELLTAGMSMSTIYGSDTYVSDIDDINNMAYIRHGDVIVMWVLDEASSASLTTVGRSCRTGSSRTPWHYDPKRPDPWS